MQATNTVYDLLRSQNAVVGAGIIVSLPPVTVSTSTNNLLLWVKNTDPSLNLHLSSLVIGVQPGVANNSGHNSYILESAIYQGTAQPTAANTPVIAGILDSSSSFVPNISSFGWNGTSGSGMTTPNLGFYGGSIVFTVGSFEYDFKGASIVAPGLAFGITAKINSFGSACSVNLILTGYFRKD